MCDVLSATWTGLLLFYALTYFSNQQNSYIYFSFLSGEQKSYISRSDIRICEYHLYQTSTIITFQFCSPVKISYKADFKIETLPR